jgi:hypothetical protein
MGPSDPLKKLSNRSLTDGTLMTSLRGMVTCILDSAPSKSKFKSTLSVLEVLGEDNVRGWRFCLSCHRNGRDGLVQLLSSIHLEFLFLQLLF